MSNPQRKKNASSKSCHRDAYHICSLEGSLTDFFVYIVYRCLAFFGFLDLDWRKGNEASWASGELKIHISRDEERVEAERCVESLTSSLVIFRTLMHSH